MRERIFALIAFVSLPVFPVFAGQLPLTVKEVSLMLRAGYSCNAVLEELSVRHFADTLDAAKEKSLQQAGASADLINALKTGMYSLSPEQAAAAQQQIVDQKKRREAEAERGHKLDTLYQDQLAQQRKAAVMAAPRAEHNLIHDLVKGDLVSWQNGSVARFDDEILEKKKLMALYFSAHWCGPCRKFTPELVAYYNRVAPQHPEFEIIFVSADKSPFAMETYMRETNMPWPAIDYQKVASKDTIAKYAGRGIPCLVLVDATGKVVSHSYDGQKYLGPQKVLSDLDAIFARGNVAQVP
jgi:nucleoredoxin